MTDWGRPVSLPTPSRGQRAARCGRHAAFALNTQCVFEDRARFWNCGPLAVTLDTDKPFKVTPPVAERARGLVLGLAASQPLIRTVVCEEASATRSPPPTSPVVPRWVLIGGSWGLWLRVWASCPGECPREGGPVSLHGHGRNGLKVVFSFKSRRLVEGLACTPLPLCPL